ncbi:hypothetical protein [Parasutterella sp.]|uniref:hypothetical protein n=1 Tax=Parasutterella sp. TaxID=2049037 RepID=UPI003521123E
MIVQDPLSKYPRLGKYALIFSIIPGYFHEYAAEEVIEQSLNRQSVHGFLKLLQDKNVAIAFPSHYKGKYAIKPEVILLSFIEESQIISREPLSTRGSLIF